MISILIWIELAILLSVPFFFSGIVVSFALTRSPYPVGLVYGADLVGAAVGCFGVLFLLNVSDGPSAVLWTGAVAALGAALFARSGIGGVPVPVPRPAAVLRWPIAWLVVLVAAAALNTMDDSRRGFYPVYAKGVLQSNPLPWFEKWNSFSRVIAQRPVDKSPQMWGPSPTFEPDALSLTQVRLNIDGDAGTEAYGIGGDLAQAEFLKQDVTNLAYYLPGRQSAAIIGVGGGRDVLSARVFGVSEVTGVEINPTFINLLLHQRELSDLVGMDQIEGITLYVDEARSWFARSEETFDVIQMSLIDTWAATGAGAFSLSENGLYTVEAWQIFLRRLSPSGVFTVSRWYAPENAAETGRMVSLAVAALMEFGVTDPQDHIFLATSGKIATLIVSKSGFSAAELDSLKAATQALQYGPLIVPGEQPASPVLAAIVGTRDPVDLLRYTSGLDRDLTPPTDERPFFFNQLPFRDVMKIFAYALSSDRPLGVLSGNLQATATLAMLFLIALGLVLAAIVIPLRHALKDVGPRLAAGGTIYFMLIGIGFMFIEIGLLQRFSVFLGHPSYSLSVVLFSLILSTGIGSIVSDHIGVEQRGRFALWALMTGGYILSQVYWVPSMLLLLDSSGLVVRGLVAIAVIMPAGFLMGYGFPTGMRFIAEVDRRPTPWFWGINGASGVLASAAAVGCSIAYGIGTTLTLGAICYFLLVPAALVIGSAQARRRAATEIAEGA